MAFTANVQSSQMEINYKDTVNIVLLVGDLHILPWDLRGSDLYRRPTYWTPIQSNPMITASQGTVRHKSSLLLCLIPGSSARCMWTAVFQCEI